MPMHKAKRSNSRRLAERIGRPDATGLRAEGSQAPSARIASSALRRSQSLRGAPLAAHTHGKASVAMHNLRGLAIAFVVMVHASLAYVASAPTQPLHFDRAPYGWQTFPILDASRWIGFDMFCAWQDVYLMALWFFLAGVFMWPSIERDGGVRFLWRRLLRLGAPILFGVTVLMPVALYPVYRVMAADPNLAGYVHAYLALPFAPCGPLWFLWLLLAFTLAGAALHGFAKGTILRIGDFARYFEERPGRTFTAWAIICAASYAPLALLFTPWTWSDLGPFAVQLCRPLLYLAYFCAGLGVGAVGTRQGDASRERFRCEKMGGLDERGSGVARPLDGPDRAGPPSRPVGALHSKRRKQRELFARRSVQRGLRFGCLPPLRSRRPLASSGEAFRRRVRSLRPALRAGHLAAIRSAGRSMAGSREGGDRPLRDDRNLLGGVCRGAFAAPVSSGERFLAVELGIVKRPNSTQQKDLTANPKSLLACFGTLPEFDRRCSPSARRTVSPVIP